MNNIVGLMPLERKRLVNAKSLNKVLYYLIRLHFVFFPFYLLLSKLTGITYWKDFIYVLCTFWGVQYIAKKIFIKVYLLFVLFTLFLQIFYKQVYLEYITWFIMGLPLCVYIKCIKVKDFNIDCYLVGTLMLFAFLWIFFFESKGGYEYTFVGEKELFTLQRGDILRVRFAFVSPMALSQYCWFSLLLIIFNFRLNKVFKVIVCSCIVYVIITCGTRAGILLSVFSLVVYVYGKTFTINKVHIVLFTVISVAIIILQISLNAQNFLSDTQTSDEIRLSLMSKGVVLVRENILLGTGGVFFSQRSGQAQGFENTWLSLVYCFGVIGLFISLQMIYQILIVRKDFLIIIFSIPWLIYSFIFPTLQEITAVHITWVIIALTLYPSKAKFLLTVK